MEKFTEKNNYRQISRELTRAVRGKYSQERTSAMMGFKGNTIHRWESGTSSPSWVQFVKLCAVRQKDLPKSLHRLGMTGPAEDFGALVVRICGTSKTKEIVERTGHSRFKISRWLSAQGAPSLDELLRIFDLQFCLIEFIELIVPLSEIPSLAAQAKLLHARKDAFYANPEMDSILACLRLEDYRSLPRHTPGFIARALGISIENETRCLTILKDLGWIAEVKGKLEPTSIGIYLTGNREGGVRIRKHWLAKYNEYLDLWKTMSPENPTGGRTGFSVMDLSHKAEQAMYEAFQDYLSKLRLIYKMDTGPKKTVKVCTAEIVDLIELGTQRKLTKTPSLGKKLRVKSGRAEARSAQADQNQFLPHQAST